MKCYPKFKSILGILLRMTKKLLVLFFLAFGLVQLSGCSSSSITSGFQSAFTRTTPADVRAVSIADNSDLWRGDTGTIWYKVQHTSLPKLQIALAQSKDATAAGWLKLAIISKQYGTNKSDLIPQLIAWRGANPSHPANSLFPDNTTLTTLLNTPLPKHIALLLPLTGSFATQGQAIRDGFLSAYYESLAKQNTSQTISFLDTNKNPNISALYDEALAKGADIVIGPLLKNNVQALSQRGQFPVPTIELNYTDAWGALSTNLYQFGLSPQDEAEQAAEKASQEGLRHAIVIAPQDEWGQRVSKTLISRWQSLGGSVTDTLYYSPSADLSQDIPRLLHINPKEDHAKNRENNNKKQLEQQRRQDFDVIFLLAPPETARQIVPLLKYYYVTKIPIYSTSVIYSGSPSPQKDIDLNGVFFCDIPWLLSRHSGNRLYAVGRDSYVLTRELPVLMAMPNFPIYAATGALTLTSKHQIYRRLPWAQIYEGHP